MAPVLLMLATSRCLRCNVWRVAAYLSLPAPVYGSEPKVAIVQRWILWLLVCLTLIVLFLCYRFQLWRLCYSTAMKYVRVNRYEEPAATDSVETLELIPTATEASSLNSSPESEPIFHDVDIKDFANKVRRMKMDGDLGFSTEFQEINEATKSYNFSAAHFYMEKNKSRNRYLNIPAYDHSRVVLKAGDSTEEESDYINANYVLGYKKPQAYIATQGPLPNTVCDFWRMVWEQNSNVIVMITNFQENGRTKCEQYWPTKGEEEYGRWTVRLMSTNHHAFYTIRVLALTDGERHCRVSAEVRTVHHYHYTQWPDHGVPYHALPVLSFVHKSAAHWKPESGPVVVHCSAGVGRTGAYILIDSTMAQIQDKCSLNIPRFLLRMRRQRHFLVQTEVQYKYVHEVLLEYLQSNGTTEVSEEQLSDYLSLLEQPFRSRFMCNTQNATLLDKQFQLITEYTASQFEFSAALDPANESKNKPGSLLPTCSSRVVLPAKPGIPGSDYINASFLQGYTKVEEFVVTQHPAEHTVPDFWRMVWHVRSPVIVVLSYPREKENVEFWPTKGAGKNLNAEGFCITTKHETALNNTKGLTILDVDMINFNEDFATLLTRVLVVKDWPQRFKKLHKVFGAISVAHSYVTSSECGPVVVVDRFGGVEAGTFCALWTLRDQLLSERCADFYQVCKLYHYKRPGIWKSQENYLFIHRALVAFHKHMQTRVTQKTVGILYENVSPCDHKYRN